MKILGCADIYKHGGHSCDNDKFSSHLDEVIVVDGPSDDAPANAVYIVTRSDGGRTVPRAEPARNSGKWRMFGGCFVYTSNGIIPHSGVPIPLFDREED